MRKEFVSLGSELFPYRIDPFSDEDKIPFERVVSLERASVCFNDILSRS